MTLDRIQGLKLNKRLMFGTRFFLELKSLNSVIQLFYLSRGLDLSQVIYLSLVWTFTAMLCDIPSSFLADKYGRKKFIILGITLTSLSVILFLFAHGFAFFTLTYILAAAGYSFYMGADQALLYDSLKESGEETASTRVAGKYFSSTSLPKIFVPFIGSLIAKDLTSFQFSILIAIDFVGSLISLVIASRLTEPKIPHPSSQKLAQLKAGFHLIKTNPILLKFALNKILTFQAAYVYWRIYQVFLKNSSLPIIYLGLIYTVFQTILFLFYWNSEKVQQVIGKYIFANLSPLLGFAAIGVSLLSSNPYILFIAGIVLLTVGSIRDPFFLAQMQVRIPTFNRATATSTLNTIKNISDIPLFLTIGYLAKLNINYVLITSGIIFLIPILFFRIRKEDIIV